MKRIWTVGHSNRTEAEFLALLSGVGIERLADVRRFPGSRTWPHFGADALRGSLAEHGMAYVHLPALGGRRGTPAEDSPISRASSFGSRSAAPRAPPSSARGAGPL